MGILAAAAVAASVSAHAGFPGIELTQIDRVQIEPAGAAAFDASESRTANIRALLINVMRGQTPRSRSSAPATSRADTWITLHAQGSVAVYRVSGASLVTTTGVFRLSAEEARLLTATSDSAPAATQ